MPRLPVYFAGFAAAGTVYGVIYKKLYLPYTTHQRDMELVIEAEKFVSQQLLQRAERILRQVATAPGEQLPSLMAATHVLNHDFENAGTQTALPRSLFDSRLHSIQSKCEVLPGRGALSFSEKFRVITAYFLFVVFFRLLPIAIAKLFQQSVAAALLRMLRVDVAVIEQRDSSAAAAPAAAAASSSAAKVRISALDVDDPDEEPIHRPDEIVAPVDPQNDGDGELYVAHVSHWIEELAARHGTTTSSTGRRGGGMGARYVFRYPSGVHDHTPQTGNNSNSNKSNKKITMDFIGHGYPWFDSSIVGGDDGDGDDAAALVRGDCLATPVVVTGIAPLLHFEDEDKKKKEAAVAAAAQNAALEAAAAEAEAEAAVAAAAAPAENAEEDLLRRRRRMVDVSRIEEEARKDEREREIIEALYGKNASDSDASTVTASQKSSQHKASSTAERPLVVAGPLDGCGGIGTGNWQRPSPVTVHIGAPCIAPQLAFATMSLLSSSS